jgi:hypothetical protein
MARYFFHLCDGHDLLIDAEGRDIADASLIPGIALKEARAIIIDEVTRGSLKLGQHIEVLDGDGAMVHRLEFRDAVTVE